MAIQYYMRGYNLGLPGAVGYVDWVVNDAPDSTATYVPSPYNPANITNITVNRTVTSKVDNFLKPFESLAALGGTGNDGYFFHLNSYDWLHATPPGPPISVPSYLTGLSVVRGTSDGIIPRDYSTLFWAEDTLKWLFAYNTNGDGYTVGAALPVGMGSLSIDGYLEVGTLPALSGIIRVPNNQFVVSRNATNTDDGYLIGQDDVDRIRLGSPPGNQVYVPGDLRVDGYIRDGGDSALSGFIRNSNATSIITFRNFLNANDISALSSTSGNLILLGDALNAGIRFNTATNFEHIFQVNSANLLRIGNIGGTTYTNFEDTASSPTVSQFTKTVGNGQNLTFKSQDTTSIGGIGGSTVVSSGHGLSADGYVDLRINNAPKIRVFGATVPSTPDFSDNASSNPNSIQLISPTVRFYSSITTPSIIQDQNNLGVNAQPMLIKAQRANAATRLGGDLLLSSGGGNAVAENAPTVSHSLDGYVRLQTGTVDRLFIDATTNRVTQTLSIFSFNGLDNTFDAAAVINPIIRQRNDVTNSITGQLMTIQAQNTTGTNTIGGSLNLTSGAGTLSSFEGDGYVRLQTGGTTRLLIDGYNNQATLTLKNFSFDSGVSTPIIRQLSNTTNNNIIGQLITVQAQNTTGANTIGGSLNLTSGTGTFADGYVRLQVGGTTKLLIDGYNDQIVIGEVSDTTYIPGNLIVDGYISGLRRYVTLVDGYYSVLSTDDYLAVDALSVYTITLPAGPTLGDTYEFKDINGTSATNNITITGSGGINIDGASIIVMNNNYVSLTVTYTGAQWSIS